VAAGARERSFAAAPAGAVQAVEGFFGGWEGGIGHGRSRSPNDQSFALLTPWPAAASNSTRLSLPLTPQALAVADRMADPIARHIADYISTLTGSADHRQHTDR
jgi:hypothetical protein